MIYASLGEMERQVDLNEPLRDALDEVQPGEELCGHHMALTIFNAQPDMHRSVTSEAVTRDHDSWPSLARGGFPPQGL